MKIVIIGGTAAGMSAAVKAKKTDPKAEVVVYEKGELVSFGACGLPYFVAGYFDDATRMIARKKAAFEEQGITVKLYHEALAVDTIQKQVSIRDLQTAKELAVSYDKLLIATGADPQLPPVEKTAYPNLFTLKTLADGKRLKRYLAEQPVTRVTLIGGGFIGVELAEAFLKLQKQVTLIQLDERVLEAAFDPEITEVVSDQLQKAGVALRLSEAVQSFAGEKTIDEVITDKGRYQTDLVVSAIGVKPATAFLGSEFQKLKNGALIVDHQGKTSVADVYAAGDCATVPDLVTDRPLYVPLATGANKLGRTAGAVMAGKTAQYPGSLQTAGLKFLQLEAARTGLTQAQAQKAGIAYKTSVIDDKNQTSYYPGQKEIRVKLVYDPETLRIIGGQIVGENGAALRIDVLAQAIAAKQTTKDLGLLDLLYAPPFARTWDVLNIAGNVAR